MILNFLLAKVKWLFVFVVFIIIICIISKFLKSKTHWSEHIKNELKLSGKEDWIGLLNPNHEIESKVKERRKKVRKQRENDEYDRYATHTGRGYEERKKGNKISSNKNEERCRKILEDYFDDYFPTCRPNFLKNPLTGRNLELDGYNARLNLAFEYQGIQHRKFTPRFHKSKEDFKKQLKRDKFKQRRLEELSINLLEIPDTVRSDELNSYIYKWLRSNGYTQKYES